jgi:hypothetical protein
MAAILYLQRSGTVRGNRLARIGFQNGPAVLVALSIWVCAPARPSAQVTPPDAVYAYTDDRGRLLYVNRLADVPEALRPFARRVDQDAAPSGGVLDKVWGFLGQQPPSAANLPAPVKPQAPNLYRYTTRDGRVVYTNLADSVPQEQRELAALDLSRIAINSKLGAELDQQLHQQYEELRSSSFCQGARAALSQPFWQRAWTEQKPLVVCGAAILGFLLVTPWMMRKGVGVAWARALKLAIPVLAFVGVSTLLLMRSSRSLSDLSGRAEPCQPDAWLEASRGDKPLVQHLQLVKALQTQTAALEQIDAESRF